MTAPLTAFATEQDRRDYWLNPANIAAANQRNADAILGKMAAAREHLTADELARWEAGDFIVRGNLQRVADMRQAVAEGFTFKRGRGSGTSSDGPVSAQARRDYLDSVL